MLIWIVVGILLVALATYLIAIFNKLVVFKHKIENAESGISIKLENIVDILKGINIVKAGGEYEAGTLKDVINMRGGLINGAIADRLKTMENIDEIIKTYFENPKLFEGLTFENYPGLKGIDLYNSFKDDYTVKVDELAKEKKYYSGMIRDYNIYVEVFPRNIIAPLFGGIRRDTIKVSEKQLSDIRDVKESEADFHSEVEKVGKKDEEK